MENKLNAKRFPLRRIRRSFYIAKNIQQKEKKNKPIAEYDRIPSSSYI